MAGNISRDRGIAGEKLAARYLKKRGYQIIKTGFRSRFGEIDIIASDTQYLVFAEVKLRAENSPTAPREYVTRSKQEKIIKTAMLYLRLHPTRLQPRFDVLEITASDDMKQTQIRLLENAFTWRD